MPWPNFSAQRSSVLIKSVNQRRSMIEQAVQATLGAYGSWNALKVAIVGKPFEREVEFLLTKGVREENISGVGIEQLESLLSEGHPDLLLVSVPKEPPFTGSYAELLKTFRILRDSTKAARVIVVENPIQGFEKVIDYGDKELSLKQIYLEILTQLESDLGEEKYIAFHDALLKEVRDENYEERLCSILDNEELSSTLKANEGLMNLFFLAQLRILVETHASKSFEAGFISGDDQEKEQLLKVLKPSLDWPEYQQEFPKDSDSLLLTKKVVDDHIDPELPELDCQIWDDMEALAGRFFDYHGKKTFNRLSQNEKFKLTGDEQFSKEEEEEKPDMDLNFRKFQVDDNPLSKLMGGGSLGGSPLGGSPAGGAPLSPPPAVRSTPQVSLDEHGETFLSLLAAHFRKAVIVGGALFEYHYSEGSRIQQGSVIALSRDESLLKSVEALATSLDLPSLKKVDSKAMLKAFFDLNKNYVKFYDRVRSQVKSSFDADLGSITDEDYDKERELAADLDSGVKVDMKARKEREKRQSQLSTSSRKAREELLKKLKDKPKGDSQEQQSDEERAVDVATIELSLSEEEMDQLNKSLEEKRTQLEAKIEIDQQKRRELEDAIEQEKLIREQKRLELEEQRKRKEEAEKAEIARRQQRLAEERKKREEVKKMRAKSLREAFDRAREAAIRKQDKQGEGESKPKDKKAEKKKFNPEAVKMMIRFGTDDKKIISNTGIDSDDLAELREEVAKEDAKL